MNRLLLDELQSMRCYPSVTLLLNTAPSRTMSTDELATVRRLVAAADERLSADDDDQRRTELIGHLEALVEDRSSKPVGHALAFCVSPEHQAVVVLGTKVDERVVVDETFATRDLVADLNRTAEYRVVSVSESAARIFLGDRSRLVEQRDDDWPLTRDEDTSQTLWAHEIDAALRALDAPLPFVAAGVQRSVSKLVPGNGHEVIGPMIGEVNGNHDRTSPSELHTLVWPLVLGWMGEARSRALDRLDEARSARRYASGIDEIFPLAQEGRIELLVVEEDYAFSARIDDHGQLSPSGEQHDHEVTDDVVDELIEAVLQQGGSTTMVATDTLAEQGRVAAVLRY